MKMTTLSGLCAIALALSGAILPVSRTALAGPELALPEKTPGFEVRWEGEMKRVHRDGDASPRVELRQLAERPGAFAIGPLAGLRGEITALDGVVYVSRVDGGMPVVEKTWDRQAPFLVYGHVSTWKEVRLPETIQSPGDLEAYLPDAASDAGLDQTAPFPFKLRVPDGQLDYHVMDNRDDGYKTLRPHQELMARFQIRQRPATLIGVYSTAHAGVFTHHGEVTHVHVVSDDGKHAGHLDSANFGVGATLFLPVK